MRLAALPPRCICVCEREGGALSLFTGLKIPASIFDRLLWPALLVLLAVAGYLLVTLPPMVVSHYRDVAADHPIFSTVYLGMVAAGGLLLLFVWGLLVHSVVSQLRQRGRSKRLPPPSKLSPAQQERELKKRLESAGRAAERAAAREAELPASEREHVQHVRHRIEDLQHKIERKRLEIVAFGAISSGKSALLNALLGEDRFATDPRGGTTLGAEEVPMPMEGMEDGRIILRDTPGLGEVIGKDRGTAAAGYAREADIVLFVVSGAIRDFEFQALRELTSHEKRIIVCLNKEDWYTPEDLEILLRQVREHVQKLPMPPAPEDVLAVRARPSLQKRMRIMADGTMQDETVKLPPDIRALEDRLRTIIQHDGRHLLLANLLLRSRAVSAEAKAVAKGQKKPEQSPR